MDSSNNMYIDCTDIYEEEFNKAIKTHRRCREDWLTSSTGWNTDLFQYGDDDFNFYRFIIDRQEKNKENVLLRIIIRIMERYGIDMECNLTFKKEPFAFIVHDGEHRIGYRFDDFYAYEDINNFLKKNNVDYVYIIRTKKKGRSSEWINRENKGYEIEGLNQKAIAIEDFFIQYFGSEQFDIFEQNVEKYLKDTKEITGFTSIKYLTSMNLASQKLFEEIILKNWDYKNSGYQIVDKGNINIQNYLYLTNYLIPKSIVEVIEHNYLDNGIFESMIGSNPYAMSFITSEWMFYSLKGKKNFDYTSVLSGYLKSIEQLLWQMVMLNTDNNCKIAISNVTKILKKAYDNQIATYEYINGSWKTISAKDRNDFVKIAKRQKSNNSPLYIDLLSNQTEYMDSSIGTFEYFIRVNSQLCVCNNLADKIADMVACFRIECRNGYFHTHNLNKWEIVEKTRENAIYLYFLLLGSYLISENQKKELGIYEEDDFDRFCVRIREFSNYNLCFIFEDEDGIEHNMIYDDYNNTKEYTEDGFEHYDKLIFWKVKDFSLASLEKLNDEKNRKEVILTRTSIPRKIIGVYRNGNKEVISM